MQPEFPRIADAIYYTVEYYSTGKVIDHLFKLAGKPNYQYLDGWNETMMIVHEKMEKEILQTIYTCNNETKVYLFETLKEWLTDRRIMQVDKEALIITAFEYNDEIYDKFVAIVKKNDAEFEKKLDPTKEPGQEYEEKVPWNPVSALLGTMSMDKTIKTTYRKFRCITEEPEYVDLKYLRDYFKIVDKLISNFRRIVGKYVQQYDEGKLVPFGIMDANKGKKLELPGPDGGTKTKDAPLPQANPKLNVEMSVPQLALLLQLLKEHGLITPKSDAELHRFISANFITPAKKGSTKAISITKLRAYFTEPERSAIKYWMDRFDKMLAALKKM